MIASVLAFSSAPASMLAIAIEFGVQSYVVGSSPGPQVLAYVVAYVVMGFFDSDRMILLCFDVSSDPHIELRP